MRDSSGEIVTKDRNIFLWILDFIKKSSGLRVWMISIIFSTFSLWLSFEFSESNIDSASGGVIAILGLLVFIGVSTPISLDEIQEEIKYQTTSPQLTGNNGLEIARFMVRRIDNVLHHRSMQVQGLSITMFGTLIWAYGWLIEKLPWFAVA
ncbi:MAG: hypothetical protein GY834_16415 [Bacteroidetes bacterium]|nr:hypothetical protein [Bacteroidota bacterium]